MVDDKTKNLGELLRSRREELEMTVNEMAESIGVSPEKIKEYEDAVIPNPQYRRAISKVLRLKGKTVNTAMAETVRRRNARHGSQVSGLVIVGYCPCENAKLSSVNSLLLVCRAHERSGNLRCKKCKTLKSNGKTLPKGTEIMPKQTI